MFVIDKENNKIDKIQAKSFHDLGFKERENLIIMILYLKLLI